MRPRCLYNVHLASIWVCEWEVSVLGGEDGRGWWCVDGCFAWVCVYFCMNVGRGKTGGGFDILQYQGMHHSSLLYFTDSPSPNPHAHPTPTMTTHTYTLSHPPLSHPNAHPSHAGGDGAQRRLEEIAALEASAKSLLVPVANVNGKKNIIKGGGRVDPEAADLERFSKLWVWRCMGGVGGMEVYGGVWRCMGVMGGMEVYGGVWRCMEVYGGVWGVWRCMEEIWVHDWGENLGSVGGWVGVCGVDNLCTCKVLGLFIEFTHTQTHSIHKHKYCIYTPQPCIPYTYASPTHMHPLCTHRNVDVKSVGSYVYSKVKWVRPVLQLLNSSCRNSRMVNAVWSNLI